VDLGAQGSDDAVIVSDLRFPGGVSLSSTDIMGLLLSS